MRGSYYQVAAGAMTGGLLTALIVYVLAYKKGIQGSRLIIAGIALSSMLASVNTWLILTADLMEAMSASVWGAGTLNRLSWEQVGPVAACTLVLLCCWPPRNSHAGSAAGHRWPCCRPPPWAPRCRWPAT